MAYKIISDVLRSLALPFRKLPSWWFRLCSGSSFYDGSNEESYRQRILIMISGCWLFSSICFSVLTPLLINLDTADQMVADALFLTTILGVIFSMLLLRFIGNRALALNGMLSIYTGGFAIACLAFGGSESPTYALLILAPAIAGIAGSITLSICWSLVVLAIWVGVLMAERSGVQFSQIIPPENRGMVTLLSYSALAVAVVSVIIIYAEVNKALRLNLQKTNLELEHLSSHDQLTRLPNRRFYEERIAAALSRAADYSGMMSVLFIDMNDFKKINDTYGHGAGDKLLIVAAERIRDSLRETDLVARLGGDEFVAIVEDVKSLDEVERLAQKLSKAIEHPLYIRQQLVEFSASIGVATFPIDGCKKQELEEKADRAMYLAKKRGLHVALATQETSMQ